VLAKTMLTQIMTLLYRRLMPAFSPLKQLSIV